MVAAVVGFAEIPIGNGAAPQTADVTRPSPTASIEIPVGPSPVVSNPFGSQKPSQAPPSVVPATLPPAVLTGLNDLTRAGYAVLGAAYTEVAAEWVQPGAACSPRQQRSVALWVGLSSRASASLEQVGTQIDCIGNSTAVLYAWFQVYPSAAVRLSVPVRPGDRIAARVVRSGSTFTFSLSNITVSASASGSRTVPGVTVDTAGWMVEARRFSCTTGCAAPPLAAFGSVSFSSLAATGSGQSGGLAKPGWITERLTMVSGNGAVKAAPSGIGSGGRTFEVIWRNS